MMNRGKGHITHEVLECFYPDTKKKAPDLTPSPESAMAKDWTSFLPSAFDKVYFTQEAANLMWYTSFPLIKPGSS